MSDIVEKLYERAASYRLGGPSAEHTAELLDIAAAEITRLRSRLDKAEAGWQGFESAPRDGSEFLATGGGLEGDIDIVSYNDRVGCWNATNYTLDDTDHESEGYSRPTHWRPLPPPPSSES